MDSDDEAPTGFNHVDVNPDNNMELPSLFWDTMPENAEEHPDMAAMKALQDEQTPEETAYVHKKNGNEKLKMGLKVSNKVLLREAITFYTQGIQVKCSDEALNSVLYCNRAHVEGLLKNWRKSLEDALESKKHDPTNVKAYFRGARAALQLKQWEQCVRLCEEGMAVDPKAPEFAGIMAEAAAGKEEMEETEARLRRSREAESAPAKALVQAILARSIKVTGPQVQLPDANRPFLGPDGDLHWPTLLMYPGGGMQQDVIQDFAEDETFSDHLDVMFAPNAPPLEWDVRNEYSRQRVELYYLTFAGKVLNPEQLFTAMQGKWPEDFSDSGPKRYGDKASRWRRVEEKLTMRELMKRSDYICPGLPVFFVVAAGTEYKDRFLQYADKN